MRDCSKPPFDCPLVFDMIKIFTNFDATPNLIAIATSAPNNTHYFNVQVKRFDIDTFLQRGLASAMVCSATLRYT